MPLSAEAAVVNDNLFDFIKRDQISSTDHLLDLHATLDDLKRNNFAIFPSSVDWISLYPAISNVFDLSEGEKVQLFGARINGDIDATSGNYIQDNVSCRQTIILEKSFFESKKHQPEFEDAWKGALLDAARVKSVLVKLLSSMNTLAEDDANLDEIADLENTALMKFNRYDPMKDAGSMLLEPHADLHSFVLIYSSEQDRSLHVRSAIGEWIPLVIPHGKAALVLGNSLQAFSGGGLNAGVHRVVKSAVKRLSVNFAVLPSIRVGKILGDRYYALQKPEPVLSELVTVADAVEHWKLLDSIVRGTPLPNYSDAVFWRSQIGRYFKYQSLRANFLRMHNLEALSPLARIELAKRFPDPPRAV